ncbi:DUF4159 domain-containing protein [Arenibaculum sp.]|uniref:DUF4159 domain-containing protein n=1 Tax=Arenibaculum sp. TaxID=2865862 RepID=UPI002E0E60BF|nr:DUF4159 domain-containing protein [Arenibaculum sp.]
MLSLGSLAFAAPWVLTALVVLPALYWLLRVTPPSPRVVRFPALRLLRDLHAPEETPARTPLWLVILRLLLGALVILALAHPLLNPRAGMPGSGPVLVVVDNGWAAGRDWPARQSALEETIDRAERAGRTVMVLATARAADGTAPEVEGPMRPADARGFVQTLAPQPWPADREAALAALERVGDVGSAHAVWLSDGLAGPDDAALAERLQRFGSAEVLSETPDRLARLVVPAGEGTELAVRVLRAADGPAAPVTLRATAEDGRLLARETVSFPRDARGAELRLDLPTELRNEVTRIAIEGESTAGAALLLDERWRRRPVGLVSGRAEGSAQPLLSDFYYLDRALTPFSEVRYGSVAELLERDLAVMVMADIGALTESEAEAVGNWVEQGGLLVRFAGPRLSQSADELVPARLRLGDRALGGALSWSEPARLAPFAAESPFAGLAVPDDVTVSRQVLAEPTLDLADRTWARLADGTPLVTAATRGEGRIVLVHTTANPDWSNLPLSGLFVQMMQRLVALSAGVAGAASQASYEPVEVLDGLGRLVPPPATSLPLARDAFGPEAVGPRHPPGFYGTAQARRALNLSSLVGEVEMLRGLPAGIARASYAGRDEVDLKPWLLAGAAALTILDVVLALLLRGLLGTRRTGAAPHRARAAAAGAAVLAAVLAAGMPGQARADEDFALRAASDTYLAYVRTGDRALDEQTHAGLEGLSQILNRRTAVETAGAMAVDLETDELAFFPLLYWAVSPDQPRPSDEATARLNGYLRNGGTILFDTRDRRLGPAGDLGGGGPGGQRLRELVEGLDVPPLAPIPPDHVLTKSFYLLQDFPGRYAGGDVWAEAQEQRSNDGVSSVIVGSNDWAGAWAANEYGQPLNAVVPGGERQREMAYRFGVNVVMYALTGNYKADQVHVPAILERLGQ